MNTQQTNTTREMQDRVLAAIKRGQVAMRPRWHYVVKAGLLIFASGIAGLGLLYVLSLILFLLRHTGIIFVPAFGMPGVMFFLLSFPWTLLMIGIGFFLLLEVMMREHAFVYRKPMVYSVFGVILVSFIGGYLVSLTGFHRALFRESEGGHVPFGSQIYLSHRNPPPNVHPGKVLATTTEGFQLLRKDGVVLSIATTPNTRYPDGMAFEEDVAVVVIGPIEGTSTVHAFGVRIIDDDDFRTGLPGRLGDDRPGKGRHERFFP